jgi:hypothetical protein
MRWHLRQAALPGSSSSVHLSHPNPAPNDVDIFLLMEDSFDVRKVPSAAHLVFDHAAAQNLLGASVFWLRKATALGGEEATIAHWQIKRDGGKRGIVEETKL